jgi:hypothetical protein
MRKIQIIASTLIMVLLLTLIGCDVEPVTTTIMETKTVTPAAQTVTITPTTQTVTVTETKTITSTVPSTTMSTSTSTSQSTTSESTFPVQEQIITSPDGKLQIVSHVKSVNSIGGLNVDGNHKEY